MNVYLTCQIPCNKLSCKCVFICKYPVIGLILLKLISLLHTIYPMLQFNTKNSVVKYIQKLSEYFNYYLLFFSRVENSVVKHRIALLQRNTQLLFHLLHTIP